MDKHAVRQTVTEVAERLLKAYTDAESNAEERPILALWQAACSGDETRANAYYEENDEEIAEVDDIITIAVQEGLSAFDLFPGEPPSLHRGYDLVREIEDVCGGLLSAHSR